LQEIDGGVQQKQLLFPLHPILAIHHSIILEGTTSLHNVARIGKTH